MSDSSAELPIDRVIEACDRKFAAARKLALKQWEEDAEKRAAWLAEEGEGYYNADAWVASKSQDWGPSKLYNLCVAAKESGESRIRVSVADFQEIGSFYRAK